MPLPPRRRAILAQLALATLTAVAPFGAAHAQVQATDAVVIKSYMFMPMSLSIKAGTTVTWKNLDQDMHTVIDKSGLIRSGNIVHNDTYSFKFDTPGVYKIICGVHPNMKETITVK